MIHSVRKLKNSLGRGRIRILLPYYERDPKVFCISIQRTGTSSVGTFFRDYGFRWVGWGTSERLDWSTAWYNGNYEHIFSSFEFRYANAYEDAPWFSPGFYKILYHRFPNAKFVLFTRNSDHWFQSMLNHSSGGVLGTMRVHSKLYRREKEYYSLLVSGAISADQDKKMYGNKVMSMQGLSSHYKDLYDLHTIEVQDFFSTVSPSSLYVGSLNDPNKWQKLGAFLGIQVPADYSAHANASIRHTQDSSNE